VKEVYVERKRRGGIIGEAKCMPEGRGVLPSVA